MFWALFNNINITAGLALNEYANHKQNNIDASKENTIFLESFDYYTPDIWLALATEEIQEIPKLTLIKKDKDYLFNIESEHFKIHYAEMLHIMYLYFQEELSNEQKVINFIRWNNDHIPFCCYTMAYLLLLFSNKIKQFRT